MNRKKFYANERRNEIFQKALYMCQYPGCSERCDQLAHRIAKTKANVSMVARIWSERYYEISEKDARELIIHHEINTPASCQRHNDSFNVGNDPGTVGLILSKIHKAIEGQL